MIIASLGEELPSWDQMQPLNNKFVGPAAAQMLPGFSQTYLMVLEGFGSAGSMTSAEENVLGVGGSIE